MNSDFPIFTKSAECQDCYKCVRRCPAKAVRVKNGSASVIPELCVSCGECVLVCPVKAKTVRNDVPFVRRLVSEQRVVASLAPSWVSCYPGVSKEAMESALKKLGFDFVRETADGAEIVSRQTVEILENSGPGLYVSSACPSAVEFIYKFMPDVAEMVMEIPSPAVLHAEGLKRHHYGDLSVVLIGPCIAKKREAELDNSLDAVLTFEELDKWLLDSGVDFEHVDSASEHVDDIGKGAFYPVEGGMLKTIDPYVPGLTSISLSGLDTIERVLSGEADCVKSEQVFVEVLACKGGCVNGPGWSCSRKPGKLSDILAVAKRDCQDKHKLLDVSGCNVSMPVKVENVVGEVDETEIQSALAGVGKYSHLDELNCAGCGYQTCREFASAFVEGKAEKEMCASYMRRLAQKKANALTRYIPAGVVVVGRNMQVIEANRRFASLLGEDVELVYDETEGLQGADLNRLLPFGNLFEASLASGDDVVRSGYKFEDRIIDIKVFSIEAHTMVGAIIEDVTEIECRREKIAEKAREVISKNVITVQQIAKCLGEHMADTEVLLRQVASGFEEN